MFRGRRRVGRARRRSVAWIDGLTTFQTGGGGTGVTWATQTFTQPNVAIAPLVWASAIQLTVPGDLTLHGGEDAVLTRIRGRLGLFRGLRNAGAGLLATTFFARILVVQTEVNPAAQIFPADYTTGAGLGRDRILWFKDVWVPSGDAEQTDAAIVTLREASMHEVDVRVKRKLQTDSQIALWIQTSGVAGTTGFECRLFGGLRILLMRPR